MLTLFTGAFGGLFLITIALAVVAFRYAMAARTGNFMPPVVVNPGAAQRLIAAALTGNKDAVLMAASEALHLSLTDGSLEQKLLQLGFADVQRQIADPNGKAPVIKAIAHFTGLTEQQVFDILKVELLGPPGSTPQPSALPPAPAVAAVALVLTLCLAGSASAASPIASPPRWYPAEQKIVIDSPRFYSPVLESQRGEILLPNHEYQQVGYYTNELYPNSYYQNGNYCSGSAGFMQRGPVRRWISGGRVLRGTGRVISAPFRFLFRRR